MTVGIIPESDSKLPSGESHLGDLLTPPPPLFWEGRRPLSSPKEQPKKTSIENANLARRWRS